MSSFINKKKGWLSGYSKRRKPAKKDNKEKTEEDQSQEYAITFTLPKCPYCQSYNVVCYKSNLPIRYYKCRDCNGNFKGVADNY
jgi:transposase-like protein